MEDLKISKIKLKYTKKGKKVKLSEIVEAICNYCDKLTIYEKSTNLTEKLICGVFQPSEVKRNVLKSYKKYKNRKIDKKDAAMEIIQGKSVSNGKNKPSFYNLTLRLAGLEPLFGEIRKEITNIKLKLNKEDLDLNDIKNEQKLKGLFKDCFDLCKIDSSEENQRFILNNIDNICQQVKSYMSNINQNLKISLLNNDLRYIQSDKKKGFSKETLKMLRGVIEHSAKVARDLVKVYNAKCKGKKIEFKAPNYYSNRMKSTKDYVNLVFDMIIKDMEKLDKLISSIDEPTIKDKISNTKQKKNFDDELKTIQGFYDQLKKGKLKLKDK